MAIADQIQPSANAAQDTRKKYTTPTLEVISALQQTMGGTTAVATEGGHSINCGCCCCGGATYDFHVVGTVS